MRFAITVVEYDEFSNEVERFNLYSDALQVVDRRTKIYQKSPCNDEPKLIRFDSCKIELVNKIGVRNENVQTKK